jgi:hypothetical protein
MKAMPDRFTKYGHIFSLINRDGDVCLYSRTDEEGCTTFEVVIAQRVASDREIDGKVVSQAGDEYYPSTNEWGRKGWTAITYDHAIRIFKERVAKNNSGSAMVRAFLTGQSATLFGGCGRCGATGLIHVDDGNYSTDCPDCGGSGKAIPQTCPNLCVATTVDSETGVETGQG